MYSFEMKLNQKEGKNREQILLQGIYFLLKWSWKFSGNFFGKDTARKWVMVRIKAEWADFWSTGWVDRAILASKISRVLWYSMLLILFLPPKYLCVFMIFVAVNMPNHKKKHTDMLWSASVKIWIVVFFTTPLLNYSCLQNIYGFNFDIPCCEYYSYIQNIPAIFASASFEFVL